MNSHLLSFRRSLLRWLPLLLAFAGAGAIAQSDPPARVATLTHAEGSVAFAPAGQAEWTDASLNRPITRGDRLWSDRGARAEVHLGSAALHMDSQTFVEVVALDDEVLHLNLNEGVVNARVRQLAGSDNLEITTPQLAFRASRPGDYRIDVDPARGTTRVTIRSGAGTVQGAGGGALQLNAGQQMAFAGRNLETVDRQISPVEDGFDRWAGDRNRIEDQSISARYVPRDVVGYQQLDAHGDWSQDPGYGAVWYPRVLVADWAPYRYGRWEWVAPWGWTWIDDAPWGFAPSHYGRWAHIGSRWAWVPGRLGPRPVYSPALVVFVGGANSQLAIGPGPGIAWFPLAPGEAWRPIYRASPVYLRNANRSFALDRPAGSLFFHQRRPDAITAVRVDDFNRGRPVHQHWNRMNPADIARLPIQAQPRLPEPRRWADSGHREHLRAQPSSQPALPAIVARPQPSFQGPGVDPNRPAFRPPGDSQGQQRTQEDQRRQRVRPRPQEEGWRDRRIDQQIQQQGAQQIQQRQELQSQRQLQVQHEAQRQEREQTARQQQARHEHGLRQQQAQERFQRQQQSQQQRAIRQPLTPPQIAAPALVPQAVQPGPQQQRGEGRERSQERSWRGQQQRQERAPQGPDDDGRGRGRGRDHRPVN